MRNHISVIPVAALCFLSSLTLFAEDCPTHLQETIGNLKCAFSPPLSPVECLPANLTPITGVEQAAGSMDWSEYLYHYRRDSDMTQIEHTIFDDESLGELRFHQLLLGKCSLDPNHGILQNVTWKRMEVFEFIFIEHPAQKIIAPYSMRSRVDLKAPLGSWRRARNDVPYNTDLIFPLSLSLQHPSH